MRTRKFIRRFHRWVGLIASLWLLVLASTGFLLQHSEKWQLDKKFINISSILKQYGIGDQYIAFKQDNHLLIQLDKQIIQDNVPTIKLSETINSAFYLQESWIVSTGSQIIWINESGQVIQSLDEIDGLYLPINKIGKYNQDIVYSSNNKLFDINSEPLNTNIIASIQWPIQNTDKNHRNKVITLSSQNFLTYEQFIFDIHAAVTTPSLFNDIAAISLIILSISGIFLFFRKRKRNRP